MVLPDGHGLIQQDNVPCQKAKMLHEWFEEHNEFEVLTYASEFPRPPQVHSHKMIYILQLLAFGFTS